MQQATTTQKLNPDYRCAWCIGNARPTDGRQQSEVQVGPDKLEVVASFCYLGGLLSAGGGCEIMVTSRDKKQPGRSSGSYYLSSHIPPPLLQDPWPCIQLLLAEHHAPYQLKFGH